MIDLPKSIKEMKRLLLIFVMLIYGIASSQELFPYLQAASPTSIYVNWKTAGNAETIVEYGPSQNQLTSTKIELTRSSRIQVILPTTITIP